MAENTLLIADIGGTNARFALADTSAPGFSQEQTLQCADFPSVEAAITHYLDQVGATAPTVICLAAAGPVVDRHIRVTNNHWVVTVDDLSAAFSTDAVRLMIACPLACPMRSPCRMVIIRWQSSVPVRGSERSACAGMTIR
jgi:glucokinase